MEKPYLLGIDIGTSACKVAAFNREGNVIAAANGDYPVYYPKEGWAEQNPEEWWTAVCGAIRRVLEKGKILPEQICGIGIDGQSCRQLHDQDGKVRYKYPYMDGHKSTIYLRQIE